MHLDTNLLLTAEVLRLEPGLVRGQKMKETFALKRVASQTYLIVNALQAGVLDEFATGKNVPDALERCIRSRSSPPLREFYDLILKAHRAGVLRSEELCAEGPAPVLRPPVRWFVSLPPVVVLTAAVIGAIATLTVFGLRPPVAPATLRDLLIGWAAVCSALSLGQILAACTLRGAGVEVHRPHVHWLTLVPHFAVDLRESCMAGRAGRAAVPAAAVLPLILTAGAGLWLHAAWSFAPLVGVALAFLPVGHTTAAQLLLLCRRQPLLDTDTSPLFDANLTLVEQARVAWQQFDGRVAALQWVAGLTWALAANRVAFGLLHFDPWPSLPSWSEGKNDLLRLGLALGVLLVIWTLRKLEHRVIDAAMLAWRQWRTAWIRWRGRQTTNDLDAVEQLVRRNPLLRRLDPDTQLELAQALKPFVAGPWRRLFAFDEEPPFVGLVLSGRATLYRRRESGRKERFITVAEGDLFGASHLIEPRDGPVELRTATPFVALTISSDDFRRLVIAPLGAAAVSRYLQHHLFLQRSCALCADWRPAAIARFAELAAATSHPGGGKIIQQGAEVSNLYVLYEGRAQAVRDRKPIGRLNPGDCFGEISLLQASAATADIESKDNGRCLVVNRVEFIRFLSRNHHVALQLERLCSKRLGRPIFPLDGHSFDER